MQPKVKEPVRHRRLVDEYATLLEGRKNGFHVRIAAMADLIDSLKDPEADYMTILKGLAQLHALAYDLHREIPTTYAWCIVKHYRNHVPGGSWAPRVWIGCTSKAQALRLAPVIKEHYIARDVQAGWTRKESEARSDDYRVEWTGCRIVDLVHPKLTVKQYLEGIG